MIKLPYSYAAIAACFSAFIMGGCDGNSGKNTAPDNHDDNSVALVNEVKLADQEGNVATSLHLASDSEPVKRNVAFNEESKLQAKQEIGFNTVAAPQLASTPDAEIIKPTAPPSPPAAFEQCSVCHSVKAGEASGVGPNLQGIYGAKAGRKSGYSYSPAMAGSGIQWTEANLAAYLSDPKGFVPGTKMIVPGVTVANKLEEIIDYLKAIK